jgi:hypothetical protein
MALCRMTASIKGLTMTIRIYNTQNNVTLHKDTQHKGLDYDNKNI